MDVYEEHLKQQERVLLERLVRYGDIPERGTTEWAEFRLLFRDLCKIHEQVDYEIESERFK